MMFRPRDCQDQRLIAHDLIIVPEPVALHWTQDVFGNCITQAHFASRAKTLRVESILKIDHQGGPPDPDLLRDHARIFPFAYDTDEMPDLLRSIERQYPDPGHVIDRWAHAFLAEHGTGEHAWTCWPRMTRAIRRRFTYLARHEPGIQDPRADAAAGNGDLPRFRSADDGGGAQPGLGGAVRLRLPARAAASRARTRWSGMAEATPTPGCRCTCPGQAGSNIDPTNGIVGSARPGARCDRARRIGRPFPCRGAGPARPTIVWE